VAFFERPTVEQLMELHISQLEQMEKERSEEILEAYRRVRGNLTDRLRSVPRGSFTAQQLRGVLVQVESAITAMDNGILNTMRNAVLDVVGLGVQDLLEEIERFDEEFTGAIRPIDTDLLAVASDTADLLLNQHEASIQSYSASIRASVGRFLTDGAIEGRPVDVILQRLGDFFFGEEWKLRRIARTELHNAHGMAKLRSLQRLDADEGGWMKRLYHPLDSRTAEDSKALLAQDPVIPITEPFRFKWRGVTRVFQAPPDRPNDRSVLLPFRSSWGE